jgi:hypothetical protein
MCKKNELQIVTNFVPVKSIRFSKQQIMIM